MTDLLDDLVEAHGGLDRWNALEAVSAHLIQGGAALVASSASSVYSSADKVGHTTPYTQQRAEKINQLPKPRISGDTRVIISAFLFRKIERGSPVYLALYGRRVVI